MNVELIYKEYSKNDVVNFNEVKKNLNLKEKLFDIRQALKTYIGIEQYNLLKKQKQKLYNSKKNLKHVRCKICNKEYFNNSGGALTQHLKKVHDIFESFSDYIEIIENIKETARFSKLKKQPYYYCEICKKPFYDKYNKSGWITQHIKNEHNVTVNEYIKEYPNYEYLFKTFIVKHNELNDNEIYFNCTCGKKVKRITQTHLNKYHNGIHLSEYSKSNQTISKRLSLLFSNLMKENNKSYIDNTSSNDEKTYESYLINNNIIYEKQFQLKNKFYDFKIGNTLVEIDGTYWHGKNINSNYTIDQFHNLVNDIVKNDLAIINGYEIKRIWTDELLENNIYSKDYNIPYFENIVKFQNSNNEKYDLYELIYKYLLLQYKDVINKSDLNYYSNNFNIKLNHIKIDNKINFKDDNYDYTYLIFREFYTSRMKNSRSILENYYDESVMKKVITYMLNKNLNISRSSIIKNLKWYRKTGVYGFSHSLTYSLLEYISEKYRIKINSIYDPFSGWGNRLVGFWLYSKDYGLQKVISNDLNITTSEDNERLRKILNFNEAKITNFDSCENVIEDVDVIFSCPPYYDLEDYGVKSFTKASLYKFIDILPKNSIKCFIVNTELKSDIVLKCKNFEVIDIVKNDKIKEHIVIWR